MTSTSARTPDPLDARGLERSLAHTKADLRLEPLACRVDQVDHRHRGLANLRGKQDEVVEIGFARSVEDFVTPKRSKAGLLLGVRVCLHVQGF